MMIMDDDVHDCDDDDEDEEDDDDVEQDEESGRLIMTRQFGRIHLETYIFGFPVRHFGLHTYPCLLRFFGVYSVR